MKSMKILFYCVIVVSLVFSVSYAAEKSPEEHGKALFKDPKFAGGSKACNECHPEGRGLEKAGGKKEFRIMGKTQKNLQEAVNFCIVNANKGKPIDEKSGDMKAIVAYIKSLSKPASPGYN